MFTNFDSISRVIHCVEISFVVIKTERGKQTFLGLSFQFLQGNFSLYCIVKDISDERQMR